MKRWATILGLAIVTLVLSYWGAGQWHARELTKLNQVDGGNLAWLRTGFDLSAEQFAAVTALHRDYATVCTQHCADILAAQRKLDELRAGAADASELAAAARELERLETVCNDATLAHIRRVAALMPEEAAGRFLALVEPHLASQPHDGDRGLDR